MPVREIGDPRLQALFGASDPRASDSGPGGVRPTVRLPRKGLPPAALAAAALFCALLLFLLLDERRTEQPQPAVHGRDSDGAATVWAPPPPLYVPPVPQPVYAPPETQEPKALPQPLAAPAPAPLVHAAPQTAPAPVVVVQPVAPPAPAPPQRTSSGAPLVIDTSGSAAGGSASGGSGAANPTGSSPAMQPLVRMRASALANRSMTVPQGYLIPAVLETGFDSTKPGFARAVVSRDVRGFDGKNVLIPRGSRLIGQYQSAIGRSQNRAVITWTRLIRPDGMTIEMQSPAVDPVGRGGVPASVNTHFFAKLGDALLQSTFAIGQAFAGRALTGPVVVLPGQVGSAANQFVSPGTNYVPTLKVSPGRSISVFVAQDLDFGSPGPTR